MKRHSRLACLLSAAVMILTSAPGTTATAGTEREVGVKDGYHWELWNEGGQGNPQMTVGDKGTYSCSWSGIKNVLFRSGQKFENYPQWKTLNGITVDFEASEYRPNGNSYLCVYGWTKQPLAEYYIVENYGNWRPPGESNTMRKVGEITANGGTYEVYKGTHDGPSIEEGVTHFNQYWSVRKDGQLRNSGQIDVSAHFQQWEQYGMEMGGLYEVALNVEGWMSSGTAKITKNDLTLGENPNPDPGTTPGTEPEPEVSYTAPSGKGTGITDGFEGTGTSWAVRGDGVKYGFNKDFVHGGSQSLYVTERSQSWHGVSAASDELEAGGSYTFSTYVGYNSQTYTSATFVLGLQYTLDGDTKYDNLAEVKAESGKWAQLSKSFTIPEGAQKISLYVQTEYNETPEAKDKISFYLDDAELTGGRTPLTTTLPVTTPAPVTTTAQATTGGVTQYSLEIRALPAKTSYVIGEALDLTGGKAEGWITEGDKHGDTFTQPFTYEAFTVDASEFDNTKAGTYQIYVKYGTATCSFEVTVSSEPQIGTTTGFSITPTNDPRYGDANLDSYVDVSDAVLVARFINSDASAQITDQGLKNADCDGVSGVDSGDITRILLYIAKIVTGEQMGKAL